MIAFLASFFSDLRDPQVQIDAIGLGAVYALMAVGIGLVLGVLRLVNFAYGQLIMAGAFSLALASEWDWPAWAGIVLCFGVVLALSLAMERFVFRPLRLQSPAVMLVATFAVACLLQSIALLWFGPLGKPAASLATLNRPTLRTVDTATKEEAVSFKERTDVTAVPAMGVVAETMVALVLADEATRKFGGDSVVELRRNRDAFVASLG